MFDTYIDVNTKNKKTIIQLYETAGFSHLQISWTFCLVISAPMLSARPSFTANNSSGFFFLFCLCMLCIVPPPFFDAPKPPLSRLLQSSTGSPQASFQDLTSLYKLALRTKILNLRTIGLQMEVPYWEMRK